MNCLKKVEHLSPAHWFFAHVVLGAVLCLVLLLL